MGQIVIALELEFRLLLMENMKIQGKSDFKVKVFLMANIQFYLIFTTPDSLYIQNISSDLLIGGGSQSCARSPKIWSRSKIKIIANDLDQKSKRSKITAIDLDQMQDQRSRSMILIFDLVIDLDQCRWSLIFLNFDLDHW